VEEWKMGMGARALGETAKAKCCMGARALEKNTMGLEVGARALEIEEIKN